MQRLGVAPSIGTVKDFADFIADEAPRWAEIVKVERRADQLVRQLPRA